MFVTDGHGPAAKRSRRPSQEADGDTECRLQVAALPWRTSDDHLEIMLITSRDTGRWVLPKGWPEEDEELYEAAAREAGEEAGISGDISTDDQGSYFYDKILASGEGSRCKVCVFPLHVEHIAATWREKGQRKRKWVRPGRAAALVNEPDLANLIRRFGKVSGRRG